MWTKIFYLIVCVFIMEIPAYQGQSQANTHNFAIIGSNNNSKKRVLPRPRFRLKFPKRRGTDDDCWMTLNAKEHCEAMEALEAEYASVRTEYDSHMYYDKFDEEILGTLLSDRGATNREAQKHGNNKNLIPSGINLGGYSMMRISESLMFFHRLKLRNDTRFRINYLTSNFTQMTLTGRLSLNDLHLIGTYERSQIRNAQPSELFYTPTYGEVQVLLRDVIYKIEGRYRLQKDRLFMEMILSELYIPPNGILMTYRTENSTEEVRLEVKSVADFLQRLKTDLDLWLKDFFNEFFLDHPLDDIQSQQKFLEYDKARVAMLNRYVDTALDFLKQRLESIRADESVMLPSFSIYTFNGMVLKMNDGKLTGLDTMYRRSMATNKYDRGVRRVDSLIAFSSLKARYNYEVKLTTGSPPLFGSLILSGDDLSAIMSLSMVKDPAFVDLSFDILKLLKPESLTVEGSVGRVISNFKHILELHIIAIMTNVMIDQVKQLNSLVKCVPTLVHEPGDIDNSGEDDSGNLEGKSGKVTMNSEEAYNKNVKDKRDFMDKIYSSRPTNAPRKVPKDSEEAHQMGAKEKREYMEKFHSTRPPRPPKGVPKNSEEAYHMGKQEKRDIMDQIYTTKQSNVPKKFKRNYENNGAKYKTGLVKNYSQRHKVDEYAKMYMLRDKNKRRGPKQTLF